MKSETAAKAAEAMNPDMNITAHQNRVGPETESILNIIKFNMILLSLFYAGSPIKMVLIKTSNQTYSLLQFTVFEFI